MCSHCQFTLVVGSGAEVVVSPDSVRGLRSQALSVVVVTADSFIEVQKIMEETVVWREGYKMWADTLPKAKVFDTQYRAKMRAMIILQGLYDFPHSFSWRGFFT